MTKILIKGMPEELHREFKKLCVDRGSNMTQELIRLMRKEVEKAGKRK